MTTTILTEAAFIALIPAGALLFLVLDRYASPRVPTSVFEEYKVLVALILGIPAGLPLAIIFEFYAINVTGFFFGDALIWFLMFVLVASLGRMIFLRFKLFAGDDKRSDKSPFYVMAFGCGTAVTILLAEGNYYLAGSADLPTAILWAILLSLLSIDIALMEGWAGLRHTSARLKGEPIYTISIVEAAALVAFAPLYLGLGWIAAVPMVVAMLVLVRLLMREELSSLRPLIVPARPEGEEKPYGRTGS
jgi:hypothetical protein